MNILSPDEIIRVYWLSLIVLGGEVAGVLIAILTYKRMAKRAEKYRADLLETVKALK